MGGVGAVGVTEGGGGLAGGPGRAGGPGGGGFAGGAAGAEAAAAVGAPAAGEVLLAVASWDRSEQRWLHFTVTQQVFHTKVHKLNTESGYVWIFKEFLP